MKPRHEIGDASGGGGSGTAVLHLKTAAETHTLLQGGQEFFTKKAGWKKRVDELKNDGLIEETPTGVTLQGIGTIANAETHNAFVDEVEKDLEKDYAINHKSIGRGPLVSDDLTMTYSRSVPDTQDISEYYKLQRMKLSALFLGKNNKILTSDIGGFRRTGYDIVEKKIFPWIDTHFNKGNLLLDAERLMILQLLVPDLCGDIVCATTNHSDKIWRGDMLSTLHMPDSVAVAQYYKENKEYYDPQGLNFGVNLNRGPLNTGYTAFLLTDIGYEGVDEVAMSNAA